MSTVTEVATNALREVLQALVSSPHLIRELQVTRGLPGNPIDQLILDFNNQQKIFRAAPIANKDKPNEQDSQAI